VKLVGNENPPQRTKKWKSTQVDENREGGRTGRNPSRTSETGRRNSDRSNAQDVWKTGNWPDDWTQSTFVPLFKKGDPTVCANYRTISLISHASKVLLKVILDRMRDKVEFEIAEEQAGFRPNRGMTEHLCNLCLITELARARRQPYYYYYY